MTARSEWYKRSWVVISIQLKDKHTFSISTVFRTPQPGGVDPEADLETGHGGVPLDGRQRRLVAGAEEAERSQLGPQHRRRPVALWEEPASQHRARDRAMAEIVPRKFYDSNGGPSLPHTH